MVSIVMFVQACLYTYTNKHPHYDLCPYTHTYARIQPFVCIQNKYRYAYRNRCGVGVLGIYSVFGTQSIHENWYRQPHLLMIALYMKLLHSRRFDKCYRIYNYNFVRNVFEQKQNKISIIDTKYSST